MDATTLFMYTHTKYNQITDKIWLTRGTVFSILMDGPVLYCTVLYTPYRKCYCYYFEIKNIKTTITHQRLDHFDFV